METRTRKEEVVAGEDVFTFFTQEQVQEKVGLSAPFLATSTVKMRYTQNQITRIGTFTY